MAFNIGENVGPYQIIEKLGQGGMATVYKAFHKALGRHVAIKVIHQAFGDDKNFLARFQREARVIACLDHPSIVPVYDFAEHEGLPYLVMKLIDGETLKERMERQHLTPEEILTVIEAVGGALSYAHKQNILHRDIKPSNVILASDGQIYLADFGLARLIQAGETTLTKDGMVGTPQYMSPEQALSRPDLDSRTDIYSLGIMLYELVVGRVPFNSDSPYTIIHDQIYTPTPPPSKLSPDVPKPLEDLLLKALAKDPADRFQEVDSLVTEYRSFVLRGNNIPPIQSPVGTRVLPANEPLQPASDRYPSGAVLSSPTPEGKASISPATQPKPIQVPKEKKKRPVWGFIIAAAFLFLAGCFVVRFIVLRLSKASDDPGNATPQLVVTLPALMTPSSTPERLVSTTSEMNADMVRNMLDEAIRLWNSGNRQKVMPIFTKIRDQESEDPALFEFSLQYLVDKHEWMMASMFLGQVPASILSDLEHRRPDLTHQVVYMAAGEPTSQDFFSRMNRSVPFFEVALARHEMVFGKLPLAKDMLDSVVGDPDRLKAFPEARLLEVELFIAFNDKVKAMAALDKLLASPVLHPWIIDFALELKTKIS